MAKEKQGWVYFALAHGREASFVKIGFTWTCPWARVKDLSTSCPIAMSIGGIIAGQFYDEVKYHRAYSQYHERGEWFRFEGELIELLNSLSVPDPRAFHSALPSARVTSSCPLCRSRGLVLRVAV